MNLDLRFLLPARLAAAAFAVLLALAPAPVSGAALDRARIHADYQGGDFEKVIGDLERFREAGRACKRADSIFLEKHLAVVYAADPRTRERGRYHMLRMLSLEPRADLLDMFVGEEVDAIFEKVRKEFAVATAAPRSPAPPATPARSASPTKARPRGKDQAAASVRIPPVPARAPVPRLRPWDLDKAAESNPAPSRAGTLSTQAAPTRPPAPVLELTGRITPLDPPSGSGQAAGAIPAGGGTGWSSRWREPGFWVGGGAAVAVLGLTLYFAGSKEWDEPASRSRTFAVPSKTEP